MKLAACVFARFQQMSSFVQIAVTLQRGHKAESLAAARLYDLGTYKKGIKQYAHLHTCGHIQLTDQHRSQLGHLPELNAKASTMLLFHVDETTDPIRKSRCVRSCETSFSFLVFAIRISLQRRVIDVQK